MSVVQVRLSDGMMRQFCRWCEDEYGHEFDPHGPWLTPDNRTAIETAGREHDLKHHTPVQLGNVSMSQLPPNLTIEFRAVVSDDLIRLYRDDMGRPPVSWTWLHGGNRGVVPIGQFVSVVVGE